MNPDPFGTQGRNGALARTLLRSLRETPVPIMLYGELRVVGRWPDP